MVESFKIVCSFATLAIRECFRTYEFTSTANDRCSERSWCIRYVISVCSHSLNISLYQRTCTQAGFAGTNSKLNLYLCYFCLYVQWKSFAT